MGVASGPLALPLSSPPDLLPAPDGIMLRENVEQPHGDSVDDQTAILRKVTGLSVTTSGATSVRVEWSAPAGDVISYKIGASLQEGHYFEVNTSHSFIELASLVPGSLYIISVSPFLWENGYVVTGPPVNRSVTTNTLGAPTDVQLVAKCDHFIRASWKYKEDNLDGFEVTLTEKIGNISEKMTLPATDRYVVFKIDPCRRNFNFTIRSYVYMQSRRHRSEPVERAVMSFGQAPELRDFAARVLTATTARVTWETEHSEDIHISVCPATVPDEYCVEYTTDSDLQVYVIRNLQPAMRYEVRASLSISLDGKVCKYKRSSQTITTPAQDARTLKARIMSISETSATVVCEGLLEQEQVRVTVNGEQLFYDSRVCIINGLAPAQNYRLQISACDLEGKCTAPTELEVMTMAGVPSTIPFAEVAHASINPTAAAFSTGEKRVRVEPVFQITVLPSTTPGRDQQPSSGLPSQPVLNILPVLGALVCFIKAFTVWYHFT